MRGSASRVQKNTPFTLVSITVSQSATLISATGANRPTPALFTSTSRPPKSASTAANSAATDSGRRTSQA
jgi:hypothetical protein